MPWVCLLLLLMQEQPELTPEQKQVRELVQQIERLAGSEPVIYGIDTRIRLAATLATKHPALAREVLRDAEAALPGVGAEQSTFRVQVVRALAPLDQSAAERLAQACPRDGEDYRALAYDQIYLALESHPDRARELVGRGFAAGAFRMTAADRVLEVLSKRDTQAAVAFFGQLLAAFPSESPDSADVLFLLQETRYLVKLNRSLVIQAADEALSAADSEDLRFGAEPKATRARLYEEIARLLASIDPELLQKYQRTRQGLRIPDPPPPPSSDKKAEDKPVEPEPWDLDRFPYADAVTRAHNIEDAANRTMAFIALSRREELTAQQRASLASEALSSAQKLPLNDDRLFLLALISRDYARRNEMAGAGLAAQMLLESYNKVCDCGASKCGAGDDKIPCLDHVQEFAEYLDEFKITPESMNLENVSLEARLAILKLGLLVNGPQKKLLLR